ncbi:hypothetical protein AVEN_224942-1 [Araneus ventricosus]|uniref:Uncharacterized protein n=1 Tax=Araneus ventricosus TaxID=182803 RepID=A0A4Y2MMB1_ARAVE|nr:hypothetical protein AVEN_224942-1 [Araneus ventricosus]
MNSKHDIFWSMISLVILTSVLKKRGTDLIILSRGQVTRTNLSWHPLKFHALAGGYKAIKYDLKLQQAPSSCFRIILLTYYLICLTAAPWPFVSGTDTRPRTLRLKTSHLPVGRHDLRKYANGESRKTLLLIPLILVTHKL